jgi:pimeloyl-ACP methyl ester carboxylesterase
MAHLDMQCYEEKEPVEWSYCINKAENLTNDAVLYHFHGRNGNATWWNDDTYYTADVYRHWQEAGISPPIVASVSFGKLWLLIDSNEDPNFYQLFLNHVMDVVETRLATAVRERMLAGESMGGFNALLVGLKDRGRFSKVAALCPPLPTVSPFASWEEKFTYIRNSSTSFKSAAMLMLFASKYFPDYGTWTANNPMSLASKIEKGKIPKLYLTCGALDSWGCMEGSEAVAKAVAANGGEIQWVPRSGGHCDIDSKSLAEFLAPVEKALKVSKSIPSD